MFNSGFAEASQSFVMVHSDQEDAATRDNVSEAASFTSLGVHDEDSDEEEEGDDTLSEDIDPADISHSQESYAEYNENEISVPSTNEAANEVREDEEGRNVRPKLSHPSSPARSSNTIYPIVTPTADSTPGPPKMRVIVKDVAYSTYRAVLYYIYTDSIHFAPLSSSFYATAKAPATSLQSASDSQVNLGGTGGKAGQASADTFSGQHMNSGTRTEWIKEWALINPGRTPPCSPKAVYKLADKLGLRELKERAFEQITKSLTVENVPYEVFSTFSATFETVRKVEVKFFLDHWSQIRASDAMRNVWQQIRLGRHPGFEEVWPAIATNLEFNPQGSSSSLDNQSG